MTETAAPSEQGAPSAPFVFSAEQMARLRAQAPLFHDTTPTDEEAAYLALAGIGGTY